MSEKPKIRVLISKPGIDGHWRGVVLVAMALRDAGMEVVFGGNQSPQEIAEAALQEDVEVVGLSILAASHMKLISRTLEALRERGLKDTLVLVGGTIPREDIPALKAMGVAEVFLPGTKLDSIVNYIQDKVKGG